MPNQILPGTLVTWLDTEGIVYATTPAGVKVITGNEYRLNIGTAQEMELFINRTITQNSQHLVKHFATLLAEDQKPF